MSTDWATNKDMESLVSEIEAQGMVSIDEFLSPEVARELSVHIENRDDWVEVFRGEEQVYDMPVSAFEGLDAEQKAKIDQLVWGSVEKGLQFRYRAVRVPDQSEQRTPDKDPLHAFVEALNSPESINSFRKLVGSDKIDFLDAQATAYSAGHFLTNHDDGVEGKGRIAAYVFSLTENWSADWGGLLVFPEKDRLKGFLPAFNSLRLFKVPQDHSVTFVPPFVTQTRYSITGWMRSFS